jgi:hypothetical protein
MPTQANKSPRSWQGYTGLLILKLIDTLIMAANRRKSKGRNGPSFVQLPHYVLQSQAWTRLSGWETKWLIDLMAQYKGTNNGDLSMPWSYLSKRGWHSRDTVAKARTGLLQAGWIVITRKGWKKIPTLYAVTLWGIDECNDKEGNSKIIEETPSPVPLGFWKQGHDPRENSSARYACQRHPIKPGSRVKQQAAEV